MQLGGFRSLIFVEIIQETGGGRCEETCRFPRTKTDEYKENMFTEDLSRPIMRCRDPQSYKPRLRTMRVVVTCYPNITTRLTN